MDSVPSELSVFLANKALKELGGPDAEMGESTTAFKMRGGISGGTLASAIAAFESVPREKLRAASMSYALSASEQYFIMCLSSEDPCSPWPSTSAPTFVLPPPASLAPSNWRVFFYEWAE
jgi:short subunit dehydrogenase-like uncharacterized protein